MLSPAYKLTVGRKVVDTTDEPQASTVVDLAVRLDLDTPLDDCRIVLGNVGGLKPAPGDEAKVELGYADDGGLTQVMTGTVVTAAPGLTTTRVLIDGGAAALLSTFVEQTFESKTAGAIVRDLADRAGVGVAVADDGIKFPAYVIDGRRSVYRHMQELAALSGFELYVDADGRLAFEEFVGGKVVHVFEFAKHIVELEVTRTMPLAGRVEAWGESPTGSEGDDASSWLTKDFAGSRGRAGEGALLLLERPALRTTAAARTAAEAALTAIRRRTLRGRVLTVGRPQVKLGDAIQLRGMADESLNDNFQVRSVEHRLTKRGGFTTTVGFRAIDVPAPAGGVISV